MPYSVVPTASTLLSLFIVIGIVGCSSKESGSQRVSKDTTSNAAESKGPAITQDEAEDFAAKLQSAVRRGSPDDVNSLIGWSAIADQILKGMELPSLRAKEFRVGFARGAQQNGFADSIVAVAQSGSYELVRLNLHNGGYRALFRMKLEQGGLNYHDYILGRNTDGDVVASDVFVFSAGERFSKTARRLILPGLAKQSAGFLEKLLGSEAELVRSYDKLTEMTDAVREGRNQEALEVWKALPESLRNDKGVLLIRLRAAQASDDRSYLEALDELQRRFGKEPWLALLTIDFYLLRKEFDQCMASIDVLDSAVGGDEYLNAIRVNVLIEKQEFAAAKALARKSLARDGKQIEQYWGLVRISLLEKQFSETSRLLAEIEEGFEVHVGDLSRLPEYSEYVQSAEYQSWLTRAATTTSTDPTAVDPADEQSPAELIQSLLDSL